MNDYISTSSDTRRHEKTGSRWYKIRNDKKRNSGNKLTIVPVDLYHLSRVNINIKVDVNMHLGVHHSYSEFSPHPEYHKLNQSCG